MILLAEHDEPSLAAKKKQRHVALEKATSTPKNRVWNFFRSPLGRTCSEPDLSAETATGSVQFSYENASGRGYYYTRDHEWSVRELVDGSGNIVARYQYDPCGVTTLVQGSNLSTKQYAGMYLHQPSGDYQTWARIYRPDVSLWDTRDPLAEAAGNNLYSYVLNNPIMGIDPFGLDVDFNSQINSQRQHFWINIGPDSNGDATYGRYPPGGNLSDLWSSESMITSPDSLHSGDTADYNTIDYTATPAEEAELKKWIENNYDLNKASTKNGPYNLFFSDCQQFAASVINKLREMRARDDLPFTSTVLHH